MKRFNHLVFMWILLSAPAMAAGGADHFAAGEIRAGLMWDTISARQSGVLRFGGSAGIHVLDGVEIGYEQQFVVPPGSASQAHTYGYLRAVPFRHWPIHPFVALQAGYSFREDRQAPTAGLVCGAALFIDHHFAFEARLLSRAVFLPGRTTEGRLKLDWRLVLYF